MELIGKIVKTRRAKAGLGVLCIAAALTAAFFLYPGPKKGAAHNSAASSAAAGSAPEAQSIPVESAPGLTAAPSSSISPAGSGIPGGAASAASSSQATAASPAAAKDKYNTGPAPEGKPAPVEPGNAAVDKKKTYTCTLSIRCDTILNNMATFNQDKLGVLPEGGVILPPATVTFNENESVFDVLKRVTREKRIHMEFVFNPMFNSAYIKGIHNLYEFDCGDLSGWMYRVGGWFPNYGASRYTLKQGDVIEWVYTCDLGKDVGDNFMTNQGNS